LRVSSLGRNENDYHSKFLRTVRSKADSQKLRKKSIRSSAFAADGLLVEVPHLAFRFEPPCSSSRMVGHTDTSIIERSNVDAFRQTWFQRRREFLASTQKISTVELAGGNLDAGQPRAGQLREASIILPRGMDGQQRSSCVLNWKSGRTAPRPLGMS
jgi:hypothetical protein